MKKKPKSPTVRTGHSSSIAPVNSIPWLTLRNQVILCVLLAVAFYSNTIVNKYALDDGLVIYENPHTQRGLDGLPAIFTTDAYQFYYKQMKAKDELKGGRYRPLSIAMFALEWELFGIDSGDVTTYTEPGGSTYPATVTRFQGPNAFVQYSDSAGNVQQARVSTPALLAETVHPVVSHGINILLFAITVGLIVLLLNRYLLPKRPMVAFLASIIFTIHPIHTEVIANIKSRDELLSLLFLLLMLIQVFRYVKSQKTTHILAASAFYFLALLSKENGITFLAIVPLTLFCFTKLKTDTILKATGPLVAVGIVFILIRLNVVGLGGEGSTGVMNDPFYMAEDGQRLPTKFVTLLQYVKLLFVPHPLSFDYGYRHFGYVEFSNPAAAFSLLLHIGLLGASVWGVVRRKVWAYGIAFYLITLSIVSNLAIPIGASIGERLTYLPSLGFAIALGVGLEWLVKEIGKSLSKSVALVAIVVPIAALAALKTLPRNAEWKDNSTLFITDVAKVPNSIKANVSAATQYINLADVANDTAERDSLLRSAIPYLEKALQIQVEGRIPPQEFFPDVYLNLGAVYHRLGNYMKASDYYLNVGEGNAWFMTNMESVVPALMAASDEAGRLGNHRQAARYLARALVYRRGDVDLTNRLAAAYYRAGDISNARKAYEEVAKLAPGNPEVWLNLGGFYFTTGDYRAALDAFQKCLALQPDNFQAQQGQMAAAAALQQNQPAPAR